MNNNTETPGPRNTHFYEDIINEFTEEDFKAEIDFIGQEKLTLKTTNAQEMYNIYQSYPHILVWDLRAKKHYDNWHLKWSVNLSIDDFKDDDFFNFNPDKIIEEHLELKVDKDSFKRRKRSMVFIVAHRMWKTHIFQYLADLFDFSKIQEMKNKFSAQDILATRNSVLLYKALK